MQAESLVSADSLRLGLGCGGDMSAIRSGIEKEMQDVSVLHGVALAFCPHFACFL